MVGDYLEFGAYDATSLACTQRALDAAGLGHVRLFGFDSFEGLPPSAGEHGGGTARSDTVLSSDNSCRTLEVASNRRTSPFQGLRRTRQMIKYIGSKRRLVPVLGGICASAEAKTALDLFTGTTRVAQEFKRRGAVVTAADSATYSQVFAQCYVETDASTVEMTNLHAPLHELNRLPGAPGYFTETFCVQSRYLHPKNGERIDAIRQALAERYTSSPLFPILLTSLIEAADRVDSTTGLQMAYLKRWAPRAHNDLELRVPELLAGPGVAVQGDALDLAQQLGPFDLAYLDPPYNQHRYFTNYHVWETLVRWDAPKIFGVACKRIDSRDESTKSPFNAKRRMPKALRQVVKDVDCRLLVLSYNDEAWISLEELTEMCSSRGTVEVLAFDSKRYVGAQIGIYNPSGDKVGKISHLRNQEYVVVAGDRAEVERATSPFTGWSSHQPALF